MSNTSNETTLLPVLEKNAVDKADRKDFLLQKLAELEEFCNLNELPVDKFSIVKDKLFNNNFVITVLGEFNRGKSTFINSLIGKAILPMGITPTTATVNIVSYSEIPFADIEYKNGEITKFTDLDGEVFKDIKPEEIKEIRIGYPSDILKGLSIVDTPGVNDISEQKLEVTYGFIPQSDAVIFVLDSEQLLSKSEANFLDHRILSKDIDKLVFIANKAENLEEKDVKAVIEYADSKLRNFVPEPVIVPYSSKLALQSRMEDNPDKLKKSYFNNLMETLDKNLIGKQESILIDNSYKNTFNLVLAQINNLKMNKQIQQKSMEELEADIVLIASKETDLNKKLEDIIKSLNHKVSSLKKSQITALKDFGLYFTQVITNEIEEIPYEDLKRFFPHFVQDKFKEWLEIHEVEINVELMKIFEESLSGLEAIFKELKQDLALDLEFSNIKFKEPGKTYGIDIGTTALMSAGLFFITVFGGLMPLIAGSLLLFGGGYLAISLKGNREKAYLEDFKEMAKNCVIKTTDKISPKLEEMITDTALKLEAQVKEIFNTELGTIKDLLLKAQDNIISKNDDYKINNQNIDKNIEYLEGILESLN